MRLVLGVVLGTALLYSAIYLPSLREGRFNLHSYVHGLVFILFFFVPLVLAAALRPPRVVQYLGAGVGVLVSITVCYRMWQYPSDDIGAPLLLIAFGVFNVLVFIYALIAFVFRMDDGRPES